MCAVMIENRDLQIAVGRAIRKFRKKNELTQAQLSEITKISTPMISRIENGQFSVSLFSLNLIASALNIPVVSLFERTLKSTDVNIVRADDGLYTLRISEKDTHAYSILARHSDGELEFTAALVTLQKGKNINPPMYVGEGYIFIRIQEGRVRYRCGEDTFDLGEGDSISFDARITNGIETLLSEHLSFVSVVAKKL